MLNSILDKHGSCGPSPSLLFRILAVIYCIRPRLTLLIREWCVTVSIRCAGVIVGAYQMSRASALPETAFDAVDNLYSMSSATVLGQQACECMERVCVWSSAGRERALNFYVMSTVVEECLALTYYSSLATLNLAPGDGCRHES